jgi:hypothetical protein
MGRRSELVREYHQYNGTPYVERQVSVHNSRYLGAGDARVIVPAYNLHELRVDRKYLFPAVEPESIGIPEPLICG